MIVVWLIENTDCQIYFKKDSYKNTDFNFIKSLSNNIYQFNFECFRLFLGLEKIPYEIPKTTSEFQWGFL